MSYFLDQKKKKGYCTLVQDTVLQAVISVGDPAVAARIIGT
jgi:hypothetical protein